MEGLYADTETSSSAKNNYFNFLWETVYEVRSYWCMAIKTHMTKLTPRREQFKKVIQLISNGAGNRNAWPNGQLTVYPWDSSIEDFILSAARKGGGRNLLFDVLERICDLNGASLDDFYSDEVNTILLVSRSLTSDGVVGYVCECPNPACGNKTDEHIRVPDELEPVGIKSASWPGYDRIKLPVCGDWVQIRPLQIKDERILLERKSDQRSNLSDTVLRILLHIQAVSDDEATLSTATPDTLEQLVTWYNALHPKDSKFLDDQERANSPHLNTAIPHKCEACGREFTRILNFDQDFFR